MSGVDYAVISNDTRGSVVRLPSPYDLAGMHAFMKRPDLRQILLELRIAELEKKAVKPKRKARSRREP